MLHGLFLSARGYDLLLTSRLGRLLPPHLVGLGLELRLLHLGLLELERIADLLGLELLGEELPHAGAILRRQIHLSHVHAAEHKPYRRKLRRQLGHDFLLNLGALAREDLARRVPGKQGVHDPLHGRADEIGVEVVRKLLRQLRDASAVDRPPHRQVDSDRQTLVRLERRRARGARALHRPVHLLPGRVPARLVNAGEHQHGARGVGTRRAVEQIGAHEQLAAMRCRERGMAVEAVGENGEQHCDHEARAEAGDGRCELANRPGRHGAEPAKGLAEHPPDGLEQRRQSIRHGELPSRGMYASSAESLSRLWQSRAAIVAGSGGCLIRRSMRATGRSCTAWVARRGQRSGPCPPRPVKTQVPPG